MKFQIVVESTDVRRAKMPGDEFEKYVRRLFKLPGFKLVRADCLEGVRPEIWTGKPSSEPVKHRLIPTPGSGRKVRIQKDPLE